VHVDHRRADATDNDGRTWSTAYGALQEAIDAAEAGDELWVAAGIYYENVTVTPGLALDAVEGPSRHYYRALLHRDQGGS
jgi:hypothetical protein